MGGWRGLTPALLTLFHAWYETAGNLALRRHERLLAEEWRVRRGPDEQP